MTRFARRRSNLFETFRIYKAIARKTKKHLNRAVDDVSPCRRIIFLNRWSAMRRRRIAKRKRESESPIGEEIWNSQTRRDLTNCPIDLRRSSTG